MSETSNLLKFAAQFCCAAFLFLTGCTTTAPAPAKLKAGDGITRHHVIIFAGTDWGETGREVDDPSSRNAVWLQTTRLTAASRNIARPGTVQVLYQEGQQPPDAPTTPISLQPATLRSLRAAVTYAQESMDADDHLTLHLSVHGLRTGNLETDTDEFLTPKQIEKALAPIPSNQRLLILDACFSGNFLRNPQLSGTRIGTSPTDKYGWIERDFSFGQFFFDACKTPSDPAAIRRAFAESADLFKKAGNARLPYIKNAYGGEGLKAETLNDLSFEAIFILEE